MSSLSLDVANLQSQAASFLKAAQEVQNTAFQAHQQTQLLIKKLNSSQLSLRNIRPLFSDHVQDINNLVNDILSRQILGREVERVLDEQRRSLSEYRTSLETLRAKKLHPALRHIAPSDSDGISSAISDSLAAWANLQQLEKLENEAVQELDELDNLVSWVKTTVDAIRTKHTQMLSVASEVLDVLSGDTRLSNENDLLQEQANLLNALEDFTADIKLHHDRVNSFLGGQSDSGTTASSRAATLVVLSQTNESLPLKMQQSQNKCSRIVAIKNELQEKATALGQLFVRSSSATQGLSSFGQECQAVLNEFEFLRGEFEVYKANLPTNVFSVLTTSAAAWKRFSYAYDEMLIELNRRRMQLFRTQEIVDAYQRELDMLHQQEQREQRRFEELHLKDFPQSWWSAVPGLLEPPIKYKIYPERFTTALPDLSLDLPYQPMSSTANTKLPDSTTAPSVSPPTASTSSGLSSVGSDLISSSILVPSLLSESDLSSTLYMSIPESGILPSQHHDHHANDQIGH